MVERRRLEGGVEKVRSHSPEAQEPLTPSWGCKVKLHCPAWGLVQSRLPPVPQTPKEKVLLTFEY